jgi:hypothetical protein
MYMLFKILWSFNLQIFKIVRLCFYSVIHLIIPPFDVRWDFIHGIVIYIFPVRFCIHPEDGFYSLNMSLMIKCEQSCIQTWFIFILFTSIAVDVSTDWIQTLREWVFLLWLVGTETHTPVCDSVQHLLASVTFLSRSARVYVATWWPDTKNVKNHGGMRQKYKT